MTAGCQRGKGQKAGIAIPRIDGVDFSTGDILPHAAESAPLPSRILVLDDEPVLRALVARILTEAGYQVATLADAKVAVEAVDGGQYDLLITNSVMSGAHGAKLVARVRERHPRLPILHLDDGAYLPPAEFPEDVPTLGKPFSSDLLLERVRDLLSRSTS